MANLIFKEINMAIVYVQVSAIGFLSGYMDIVGLSILALFSNSFSVCDRTFYISQGKPFHLVHGYAH
jgi:hypothetical protein